MNVKEINDRLNDIKIENFIWIIYIGIIALSYYANCLERKYFLTGQEEERKKYREVLIFIFVVLIIIYLYFFYDAFVDLKNVNKMDSNKKKRLLFLSFLGSLLILISGIIYLYIIYQDEGIDVEIAFN